MNPYKGQGRILSLLKMQPEIGQKEIGYLLDISKQALSDSLSKLEKSGYITRIQSEKDKRSYIIKLTDSGFKAAPDSSSEKTEEEYQSGMGFECLRDDEQRTLSDYLGRIIAAMEEMLGDNDDDYAEFIRERFLMAHGLGAKNMRKFGHRGGLGGFGGGRTSGHTSGRTSGRGSKRNRRGKANDGFGDMRGGIDMRGVPWFARFEGFEGLGSEVKENGDNDNDTSSTKN
jgi:DNA-binding MarR family transcriptional regulator